MTAGRRGKSGERRQRFEAKNLVASSLHPHTRRRARECAMNKFRCGILRQDILRRSIANKSCAGMSPYSRDFTFSRRHQMYRINRIGRYSAVGCKKIFCFTIVLIFIDYSALYLPLQQAGSNSKYSFFTLNSTSLYFSKLLVCE